MDANMAEMPAEPGSPCIQAVAGLAQELTEADSAAHNSGRQLKMWEEASMYKDRAVSYAALALATLGMAMHAQAVPDGCAWDVAGQWRVSGRVSNLKAGDPVPPGALVIGAGSAAQHLIVLLPDGQRVLLECHDQPSCSRGFRVPALTEQPEDDTIAAFQQVSLLRGRAPERSSQPPNGRPATRQTPGLLHAEGVAALEADGTAEIASVIKSLPSGNYRLVLKSDSGVVEQALRWNGAEKILRLHVGKANLYKLIFYGSLNTERMRATILVVQPAALEPAKRRLDDLRETIKQWTEHAPAWPLHDFLALYLEALRSGPADLPQQDK